MKQKSSVHTGVVHERGVELFLALLKMNLRLTFLVKELNAPLHLGVNHLFSAVNHHPGITAKELIPILHLEKSTVSRTVSRLIQQKYLEYVSLTKTDDKRTKPLRLTKQGVAAFEKDALIRDAQVSSFIEPLEPKEQRELTSLFIALGDVYGTNASESGRAESAAKVQIRRLTRSLGVLGDNFLSTGRAVSTLQILRLLFESPPGVALAVLTKRLPYDRATLHRILNQLEEDRAIAKAGRSETAYRNQFILTDKGIQIFQEAELRAAKFLAPAIESVGIVETARLTELMLKASAGGDRGIELEAHSVLTIEQLSTEEARAQARALLVQEAIREKKVLQLKECLFRSKSICIGLREGKSYIAALEATRLNNRYIVENLVIVGRHRSELREDFLAKAMTSLEGSGCTGTFHFTISSFEV